MVGTRDGKEGKEERREKGRAGEGRIEIQRW